MALYNPQQEPHGGEVRLLPPQPMGVEKAFAVLAQNLPGFEKRHEQYMLTVNIASSLHIRQHLVAEAPTGTGKSFAIGLGVVAEFYGTKKKAVIATANNNLLEQYATKDLPFLASLFPGLKWARAKGKGNYLCIDKAEKEFGQQTLFDKPDGLKRLKDWCDETYTGDKEEIAFSVPEADWAKVNADDSCTGTKCPFYDQCHYYNAKVKLREAQIIVTNFDLVLIDAFNPEAQIFPEYNALVLDEAHQLEDKAISKLERSLTERQILSYIKKADSTYKVPKEILQEIHLATARLFNTYRELLQDGKEKVSIIPTKELLTLTSEFWYAMNRLQSEIGKAKTGQGTRDRKQQENLMSAILNSAMAAEAVIQNDEKHVSWVEQTKTDVKIVTCPFRVGFELFKVLFSDTDKTIVTLSATLAVAKSGPSFTTNPDAPPPVLFEQFRQKVGMVNAGEFICPSPFNYKQNCVLYLPKPPSKEIENPNTDAWMSWAKTQALELVRMSKGRAFVLTTSTRSIKEFGDHLSHFSGLPVKVQSREMSNSQLIQWFKSTPNSVIVATSSFWEGVSIEGDDLKLVIIDKIPFTPHGEPIQQAREAYYKADPKLKSRAFMDLAMYPAIIRLKQGFGRLIRTKADTGAVAILDPRLTVARYKNTILNSLPNAARVTDLHDPRLVNILK